MDLITPYYKKTIPFSFENQTFDFLVSQELFSSQVVDHGTQRLLRTLLFEHIDTYDKVLDLGCGYGPIGIVMKKMCPSATVHMVDRDALALAYTSANLEKNGITDGVSVYGSLGYDSVVDHDFDLIVSNIPAKVGEHVLHHMLTDARSHLRKDGKVIIVVIDAINDFVHQTLVSDPSIEITYEHAWPGHHVYHYRFRDEGESPRDVVPAFARGEYERTRMPFTFQHQHFTVQTTYHLPEFDSLSFDTTLLLQTLGSVQVDATSALVFNPGQGYLPLAVVKAYHPQSLVLVDRNLQALSISTENVVANGYERDKIQMHHQVGIAVEPNSQDLMIGILGEQQNTDVYLMYLAQAEEALRSGGLFVLASSSTVITRIEEVVSRKPNWSIRLREKNKGRSVMVIKKK